MKEIFYLFFRASVKKQRQRVAPTSRVNFVTVANDFEIIEQRPKLNDYFCGQFFSFYIQFFF